MRKQALKGLWVACVCLIVHASSAAAEEIVLYATDASTLQGHWTRMASSTSAGGQLLSTPDQGWQSLATAQAAPAHYVEFTFNAPANTPFRVWLRLRGQNDSKWNESVFVQFSDAITSGGAPLHRIGTTAALLHNLQPCNGCAFSGWGWPDGAYWLQQASTVRFAAAGPHTIRVQTREDGVQLDQVVLSSSTYASGAPGTPTSDTVVVGKGGSTPFKGSPFQLPGIVPASDFDNGGEGVSYHDLTAANDGGAYRSTGVDLHSCTEGPYCVGWTQAGEWLNYSVDVASAGAYNLEVRVAAYGEGGTFHVEFGGTNVTGAVTIPNTNGWQNWTTVSKTVSLNAGRQLMKLALDTAGTNAVGNITQLRLTAVDPAGSSGQAIALPGTFQAVDFAAGGEGTAYHDTNPNNLGGQYRNTGVDIEACSLGGHNVGWIEPGEWLSYEVSVATAGTHAFQLQVASMWGGARLRIQSGSVVSDSVEVPNTGGWQTWRTVTVLANLAAGPQTLKLIFETSALNVAAVSVAHVPSAPPSNSPAPPTGGVIAVPSGGDFQAALDAAQPGDTILLQAGATYVGNFVLPVKNGDAFITIRSSASDGSLPSSNARMQPSYAANLPKLKSPNGMPVLQTAPRSHHYRLMFLEFLANRDGFGDIVTLGHGEQTSLLDVPHNLVVDRVYIHGDVAVGQKRGIALNSAATTIRNSYISEIKAIGQDSQAIAGWNGPGPYTITNNYLEAAGENLAFGGDDPRIVDLVPSDITITRNHLSKQLAWRSQPHWTLKNLFELKNAQRVVVDGNLMEYNWKSAQAGEAILFTPRNQYGRAPWSVVRDIRFTNNIIRHVAAGVAVLGRDYIYPSQVTTNVVIRNNLFYDVSADNWAGSGRFLLITDGPVDLVVEHNTVLQDGYSVIGVSGIALTRFVFSSNIVPDYSWAIIGADRAPGNSTIATYFPNSSIVTNIIAGADPTHYPPANFYPGTLGEVGFVNLPGGDYRLAADSIYRGAAIDGKDVGVDFDALNAAIN